MNKEAGNKAYYQETFQEVHAPEALAGKVRNMTKETGKKIGMSVGKKLAAAAAIAAVLFAGSNGVAYAMTGSTWLETVIVRMNINGTSYEMEMDGELLEDGTVQYSGTVEVPDGAAAVIINSDSELVEQDYYIVTARTEVVEENGRVYLVDDSVRLDITEDVQDGRAAGEYEKDGVKYQYEVSGSAGKWEFSISSSMEETE